MPTMYPCFSHSLHLFLFLSMIHTSTNRRPPFKTTTTKNVSRRGGVALFPHREVGGELTKPCSSAWSRLHSTIANPLDFRPLASDPIEARMKAFFGRALSTTLANITFDTMENVDELEVYPSRIPDLLSENPLIVSGSYKGDFPETLKARGILADMSNFIVDLKVQKAKDIPIDKVLTKQEIDLLTDQVWFSENKELEEKIARMSVKYGIVSEYTCMILLETERGKNDTESTGALEGCGSSKRKLVDVNPVSETPKLFTFAFKVPKLKNSSCHVI